MPLIYIDEQNKVNHLRKMMESETISAMLDWNSTFICLIAQEDFIAYSHHESFKSYQTIPILFADGTTTTTTIIIYPEGDYFQIPFLMYLLARTNGLMPINSH
jgi:hypothetical protein